MLVHNSLLTRKCFSRCSLSLLHTNLYYIGLLSVLSFVRSAVLSWRRANLCNLMETERCPILMTPKGLKTETKVKLMNYFKDNNAPRLNCILARNTDPCISSSGKIPDVNWELFSSSYSVNQALYIIPIPLTITVIIITIINYSLPCGRSSAYTKNTSKHQYSQHLSSFEHKTTAFDSFNTLLSMVSKFCFEMIYCYYYRNFIILKMKSVITEKPN